MSEVNDGNNIQKTKENYNKEIINVGLEEFVDVSIGSPSVSESSLDSYRKSKINTKKSFFSKWCSFISFKQKSRLSDSLTEE